MTINFRLKNEYYLKNHFRFLYLIVKVHSP